MNHLEVLGTHNEFNYVLYNKTEDRLDLEYKKVIEIIKNNGHVIHSDWDLTGGILLESNQEVIAGIFYNTTKYKTALLIHAAYVSPTHRRQGIYTKLHELIDQVGMYNKMENVFSYIHLDNKPMVDFVMDRIGYRPILNLVSRPIRRNIV